MGLDQRDASVLRRFEHFCAVEGLTFDGAFHDAHVVEAFLLIGCSTLSAHSLGTYRSTLRRIGGAPQTTRARIDNATVLLAAMVGAGLRPRELAHLHGSDVEVGAKEVSVRVRGSS